MSCMGNNQYILIYLSGIAKKSEIEVLQEADVLVEVNVLDGRPYGYSYTEGWIPAYAQWLENIFANS